MTLSFKHIGLATGVGITYLSFLFFGRQHETYQILLIFGIITTIIFFLTILLGKCDQKVKIFWTVIFSLCVVIQQLTEPILIDTSYRIFISQNKNILTEINNILINKQDDITIINGMINSETQLTTLERNKIKAGWEKLGVYIISKSKNRIFYGLWGFLDVRLGITHLTDNKMPAENERHLTGNWYH